MKQTRIVTFRVRPVFDVTPCRPPCPEHILRARIMNAVDAWLVQTAFRVPEPLFIDWTY